MTSLAIAGGVAAYSVIGLPMGLMMAGFSQDSPDATGTDALIWGIGGYCLPAGFLVYTAASIPVGIGLSIGRTIINGASYVVYGPKIEM
jgi:hypothetical protein